MVRLFHDDYCIVYSLEEVVLILLHFLLATRCTVKPAHVVTCIKRSPFSGPVIENFIWIELLLRGHLSYKATFSLFQRWPLNTGLTVYWFFSNFSHTCFYISLQSLIFLRGHLGRDRDRMVVGFTTTCAIYAITTKVQTPFMARSTRYNIMW